jgi:tRNA U34 5-methylaminomethyl-2-thiouridine-forming methyltransferase MnmC
MNKEIMKIENNYNNRSIVLTEDGSHTLYVMDIDESFHSRFGAVQESEHIFIQSGLLHKNVIENHPISVLEIGFGTGLNALLTCMKAEELKKDIFYQSIELYPLTSTEYNGLNYGDFSNNVHAKDFFSRIHHCSWETIQSVSHYFKLLKQNVSALSAHYPKESYDVVYFDAFSPDVQPELWTKPLFEKIYQSMKSDGILVTYCTKGVVKNILKEIGFHIEKLPGPKGKREILRAEK